MGEPLVMTDVNKNEVWNAYVEPFGLATVFGASSAALDLRLPGQWLTAETGGLNQNGFRDYDPTLGRYVQPDPVGLEAGQNVFPYVDGDPEDWIDTSGLQAGLLGCVAGPEGCAAGLAVNAATVALGEWMLSHNKPPKDACDPNGAKAPGKPGKAEGFSDPKGGPNWVPNPNGRGNGWQDSNGDVWVPTGQGGSAHGGPHWDKQTPGGGYTNVYPGGAQR